MCNNPSETDKTHDCINTDITRYFDTTDFNTTDFNTITNEVNLEDEVNPEDDVIDKDTDINEIIGKIIERDFCRSGQPCLDNNETLDVLKELYKKMIDLKNTDYTVFKDGILIDTCYFFRGVIPTTQKIIITDGVIMEILQGSIYDNLGNCNYLKDLKKILSLKNKMGDKCILVNFNCRLRQYYPRSRHLHSLRRNVDSELLLFVLKVYNAGHQIKLATFDKHLRERIGRRQTVDISESVSYNGSYRKLYTSASFGQNSSKSQCNKKCHDGFDRNPKYTFQSQYVKKRNNESEEGWIKV
jgi:hypothetical protein